MPSRCGSSTWDAGAISFSWPDAMMLKRWIRQAERPIEFAAANGDAEAGQVLDVFAEEKSASP
eukprot:2891223-Alexandrium_andersonii.AAC.1